MDGLTTNEKKCLGLLADAWNTYVNLEEQHPDDVEDFRQLIHRLQYIVGVRVARRVPNDGWAEFK